MINNGYNAEAIYDDWKTTELIVTGTLAARARVLLVVDCSTLKLNERDDLPAIFARLSLVADKRSEDLLFSHVPLTPLVEPVRRHNVIRRAEFMLENVSDQPLNLDFANGPDHTGQDIPDGLLIMLSGELAAPLWNVGQTHLAQPAIASDPHNGFSVVSRFNQALPFNVRDITLS